MSLFVFKRSKIIKELKQEIPYTKKIGISNKTQVKITEDEILPYKVDPQKVGTFDFFITITNTDTFVRYVTVQMNENRGWELEAVKMPMSVIIPSINQRNSFDIEIPSKRMTLLRAHYQANKEGNGQEVKIVIDFYRNRDVDGETGVQLMEIVLKGGEKGIELVSSDYYKYVDPNPDSPEELIKVSQFCMK